MIKSSPSCPSPTHLFPLQPGWWQRPTQNERWASPRLHCQTIAPPAWSSPQATHSSAWHCLISRRPRMWVTENVYGPPHLSNITPPSHNTLNRLLLFSGGVMLRSRIYIKWFCLSLVLCLKCDFMTRFRWIKTIMLYYLSQRDVIILAKAHRQRLDNIYFVCIYLVYWFIDYFSVRSSKYLAISQEKKNNR